MCRPTTTTTSTASVSVVSSSRQSISEHDETVSLCSTVTATIALHQTLSHANKSDAAVVQQHERHSFINGSSSLENTMAETSSSSSSSTTSLSSKQRRVSFPEGNDVVTSVIYRAYTPIEDREILFYQSNDYIQFKQEFRRLKKQFLEMKLKKKQQQQEQEAKAAIVKAKTLQQQQQQHNGDDFYYDDDEENEESLSCMERVMYSLTCKWLTKALQ